MKYKAVTTWQGEPEWELTITFGKFDEIETAAKFGNEDIKKLEYDRDFCKLNMVMKDGTIHQVQPHQLVVSKQKPETMGKLMVDANDFEPVDVKIEEFTHIDGLDRGFGSLAYGVVDEDGNPVDCSEYHQQMLKRHEEKMRGVKPQRIREM
ncbi:MAG: hypothetical protein AB4368_14220 [Xenococcaceae cyanobacterium]